MTLKPPAGEPKRVMDYPAAWAFTVASNDVAHDPCCSLDSGADALRLPGGLG